MVLPHQITSGTLSHQMSVCQIMLLSGRSGIRAAIAPAAASRHLVAMGAPMREATCVKDLFQWPLRIIQQLQAREGQFNRFLEMLHSGHVLTTDYSGIQCPEMAINFVHNACRAMACSPVDLPRGVLTFVFLRGGGTATTTRRAKMSR